MEHTTPFFKQCKECNTTIYYKTFANLRSSLRINGKCKRCFQKEKGAYSEEDEEFLRNNYSTIGQRKCSEKLNRSMASITVKANKMGLSRHIPCDNSANKRCGRCHTEQSKTCFGKSECRKDGLYPTCKKCLIADRELPSYKRKKYEYDAVYRVLKMKTDIVYRIKHSLRRRMKNYLKRKDRLSTIELLGCSAEECIRHLESLFTVGMSWENYGFKGWHIDHIIPCASFNLLDVEDQKKCFNYKNLQPLWWWENLSKGTKIL